MQMCGGLENQSVLPGVLITVGAQACQGALCSGKVIDNGRELWVGHGAGAGYQDATLAAARLLYEEKGRKL